MRCDLGLNAVTTPLTCNGPGDGEEGDGVWNRLGRKGVGGSVFANGRERASTRYHDAQVHPEPAAPRHRRSSLALRLDYDAATSNVSFVESVDTGDAELSDELAAVLLDTATVQHELDKYEEPVDRVTSALVPILTASVTGGSASMISAAVVRDIIILSVLPPLVALAIYGVVPFANAYDGAAANWCFQLMWSVAWSVCLVCFTLGYVCPVFGVPVSRERVIRFAGPFVIVGIGLHETLSFAIGFPVPMAFPVSAIPAFRGFPREFLLHVPRPHKERSHVPSRIHISSSGNHACSDLRCHLRAVLLFLRASRRRSAGALHLALATVEACFQDSEARAILDNSRSQRRRSAVHGGHR